jgi:hypothetical protein
MPGLVQGHFHSGFGPSPTLGAAPILGLEAAPPYLGMVASRNAQIALQCGVTGVIGSSNGDNLDVCLREAIILGLFDTDRRAAPSRRQATWPAAPTAPGSWASSTGASPAGSTAQEFARRRAGRSDAAAT